MPINFYQLLAGIEKRPLMYIQKKSINNLKDFIDGYRAGALLLEVTSYPEDVADFGNFNNWVRDYYGYAGSTAGWRNMILDHSKKKKKAFHTFFKLLHRFLQGERPPANPKAILYDSEKNWVDDYLSKRATRQTSWWEEYQASFNPPE